MLNALSCLLGSEVTARLAVAIVQVSRDLLRPLPMNTPVTVQGARPWCVTSTPPQAVAPSGNVVRLPQHPASCLPSLAHLLFCP